MCLQTRYCRPALTLTGFLLLVALTRANPIEQPSDRVNNGRGVIFLNPRAPLQQVGFGQQILQPVPSPAQARYQTPLIDANGQLLYIYPGSEPQSANVLQQLNYPGIAGLRQQIQPVYVIQNSNLKAEGEEEEVGYLNYVLSFFTGLLPAAPPKEEETAAPAKPSTASGPIKIEKPEKIEIADDSEIIPQQPAAEASPGGSDGPGTPQQYPGGQRFYIINGQPQFFGNFDALNDPLNPVLSLQPLQPIRPLDGALQGVPFGAIRQAAAPVVRFGGTNQQAQSDTIRTGAGQDVLLLRNAQSLNIDPQNQQNPELIRIFGQPLGNFQIQTRFNEKPILKGRLQQFEGVREQEIEQEQKYRQPSPEEQFKQQFSQPIPIQLDLEQSQRDDQAQKILQFQQQVRQPVPLDFSQIIQQRFQGDQEQINPELSRQDAQNVYQLTDQGQQQAPLQVVQLNNDQITQRLNQLDAQSPGRAALEFANYLLDRKRVSQGAVQKKFSPPAARAMEEEPKVKPSETDVVTVDAKDKEEESESEMEKASPMPLDIPDEPSVAQVSPAAYSVAGKGGVATAGPVATALVGPGGLALASPLATAVAVPGTKAGVEEI